MEPLADGVYEAVRTHGLNRALDAARGRLEPEFAAIGDADAPDVIARHVAEAVRRALAGETDAGRRVELANRVLRDLAADEDRLAGSLEQLIALNAVTGAGARRHIRPVTPLSQAALLTNAKDEPNLSAELRAELASADRVDLLCAFIRWPGLRLLESALRDLSGRNVPFRVLTTTYVGATERPAIDRLVRQFGADVRISYETQSTRLHAKAWLFRRASGYDTAFVGSSNLSRSALVDGLEWNVRLSGVATPELLRKFEATFDTYWESNTFVPYDPDTDADRFDDALRQAGRRERTPTTISLAGLEVRPLPHQQEVLEALDSERQVHDRHRNLVVAATGTGKTVIAALDFRRLRTDGDPSLLFVAHRKEILHQALRVHREVLVDETFGETYVDGTRPERWRHVFASVQGLAAHGIDRLPPDHFDIVVIDEFHHALAPTYQRLLDHLRPSELLGLTATPERGDGGDVRTLFGGRSAYELPLWDALSADLLVPFHYFGVADGVDLSDVQWTRGIYDVAGVERLYTGNDARAARVLTELRDKVTDVGAIRALGFCVSVAHAEYMARVFREAGIRALAVSNRTSRADRDRAVAALRAREVNVLFAVDLFNEGLDIPELDTALLLRPTESATIFLQQLGRGLRRAPGKTVLTVLDFIGQHRKEYRFDTRFRALTGSSRRGPAGSQVVLDRVARDIVLDNVRTQLRFTRTQLAADVRSHGELSLSDYLRAAERDLTDVHRNNGSWTSLRREAGLSTPPPGPDEGILLRRMAAFTHVDDRERAQVYQRLVAADGPDYDELDEREQRLARMLLFTLWPKKGGFPSYAGGIAHLRRHPAVCAEIAELAALGLDRARHVPAPLGEGLQHIPLAGHSHYRREEILAALGYATLERVPGNHVSGVAWCDQTQTDALLINLHKSEKEFSPTTMYRDYAISPELFHWESQNHITLDSPTDRRYREHRNRGSHVVLFARQRPTDDLGAAPFVCLGPATYVEHRGERPIAITWRLHRPMPADTFSIATVAG